MFTGIVLIAFFSSLVALATLLIARRKQEKLVRVVVPRLKIVTRAEIWAVLEGRRHDLAQFVLKPDQWVEEKEVDRLVTLYLKSVYILARYPRAELCVKLGKEYEDMDHRHLRADTVGWSRMREDVGIPGGLAYANFVTSGSRREYVGIIIARTLMEIEFDGDQLRSDDECARFMRIHERDLVRQREAFANESDTPIDVDGRNAMFLRLHPFDSLPKTRR